MMRSLFFLFLLIVPISRAADGGTNADGKESKDKKKEKEKKEFPPVRGGGTGPVKPD